MSKKDKKRQKLYENYVNEVNNRIKTNQESQDKMILTISSALFGLLPFFIEKLQLKCWLGFFVGLLIFANIISLIAVLFSFYFCAKGNRADIDYAKEYYIEDKEDSLNKKSNMTKKGEICNEVSLFSFAVTLISFAIIIAVHFFNKE